jgi:hypothetical protein
MRSTCAASSTVFVSPPARVTGTAVFLTAEPGTVPNAMLHNLKHNKVLHEHNLFVTVRNHEVPWVGLDKRIEIEALGHDCWQVIVHYGFKNDPDVPRALEHARTARLRPRADDDQLLPLARRRGAHHRRRHGAVAREAVRADAPQRRRGGGVPQPAEQRGGGAGVEDRDLSATSAPSGSARGSGCVPAARRAGGSCSPAAPIRAGRSGASRRALP